MRPHVLTLFAALLALAACAEPAATSEPEPRDSVAPAVTGDSSRLHTQCAGREYAFVGLGDEVHVQRDDGIVLTQPQGMEMYVPVGLGCAHARGGEIHLVVQYGEPLVGCKVCEWFFVYDAQGRPMHDSVPALFGEGSSLAPNNTGYAHMSRQLGLEQPQIQYDATRHN